MDVATEEPLLDGEEPITAQTIFTPKESEGTVDVVFTFDLEGGFCSHRLPINQQRPPAFLLHQRSGQLIFLLRHQMTGNCIYNRQFFFWQRRHDVVVFEKLYVTTKDGDKEKEVELTSHEDIQAESQTVKLTEVPPEPEKPAETPAKTPDAPKTGDTTNP